MNGTHTAMMTVPAAFARQRQTVPPDRVLVVEDDSVIRRLICEVLTNSGFEAHPAKDGAAGWDQLQANDYDLLITDNTMPKLTGVELLRKLREARMVLPVIMATGVLPKTEFAKSPWLIPDATLIKPFTMDELLAIVHRVLEVSDSPRKQIIPPNHET